MRNTLKGLILALIMAFGFTFSSSATAREVYHGFVNDQFYLGRGGTPATFEQAADNSQVVFRSQLAYDNLRAHVGASIGRPLSDADFRSLLKSDDVRLVPCVGKIDTSGVNDAGSFDWRKRACYRGEMLIQVRLADGSWLTVASQGCYNPVRGEKPILEPGIKTDTPVKKKQCRFVTMSSQSRSSQGAFIAALLLEGCSPQYIQSLLLQGSPIDNMTTTILVCN